MNTDATVETLPPAGIREAVAALWRMRSPGHNLFSAPEFAELRNFCHAHYPSARSKSKELLSFPLINALGALGLPCSLPPENHRLALAPNLAAARLHTAFERTDAARIYLCPLDKANGLPEVSFGPNRIARLTSAELEELVDVPRLRRTNAQWALDAERFSKFTWLVIRKTFVLDRSPQERAIPMLFEKGGQDWGAIEPHRQRIPAAVERALFAILLAPWEDWVKAPKGYWRGFDVPWVYQLNDDIFVRPLPPPSPDTLSWGEPFLDEVGEEVFGSERPDRLPLNDGKAAAPEWLNDARWSEITCAWQTALFETPIAHFFVKAFLAEDPLDEFLAHVATIEAALGLKTDYPGATKRVAARVSALLENKACGRNYCCVFDIRSTFLHGRKMGAIPSEERVKARRLAREVVSALVKAALTEPIPQSRPAYLTSLK